MSEGTTEIFKPEAKSIEQIFGNADSFYQVPDYQRPYCWEEEQIAQLWDDIYSAMESGDETYFLGPVILIEKKEGSGSWFEVVDGQQRLTTLTILFCVIRDLYSKKLEGLDQTLTKKIQNSIKSLVEEKPRLRLITQLNQQNEFENEILNGVNFKELKYKEKEKEKFINAANILKQKLGEREKEGGIEAIKKFTEYILRKVEMITIICTQQEYAIKLFQVLNTRGLDLTPADLIKSHLYSKLEEEIERNAFNATWQDVETISEYMGESVTNLFTYYGYYLLAKNPKRSLYEELIDEFKGKDSNKVIHEFNKFVDFFHGIWNLESKLIYSFWYLPDRVYWKAILTTAKKEEFTEFEGLCKELRKMYYSYWIAGYTTSKIKQLSFNIIGWLKEKKEKKELGWIADEIEKKMNGDNVIIQMRENLQGDVYGKSWLRPLLALVEYDKTDNTKISYIELNSQLHVDHILPQGWESVPGWNKNWTKQQAEKWLHKIGNLTLLSGRKNIAQGNAPPAKKKEIYEKGFGGKTAFEISKEVIETLKFGWTEKDVEERQNRLINQIEGILGVKLNEGYN